MSQTESDSTQGNTSTQDGQTSSGGGNDGSDADQTGQPESEQLNNPLNMNPHRRGMFEPPRKPRSQQK